MAENPGHWLGSVQRFPETGIEVVIAGAGIGGLWTALECWRKGHTVRIFDKTEGPVTAGDFFTLNNAACLAFEHWPHMEAEHKQAACQPLFSCYQRDGKQIVSNTKVMCQTTDEFGAVVKKELPAWRHLRSRLQSVLLKQLEIIGLSVEYGRRIVKYSENPKRGLVEFDDGSFLEGDVVVAADGIWTQSNELVLGHAVRARSSGSAIYRCAYPNSILDEDPVAAEHFKPSVGENSAVQMWVGPKLHVVTTRNEDTFSWALMHRDEGTSEEAWSIPPQPCRPVDVVKSIERSWGSCPDVLQRMISTTPESSLVDFKIMWRDSQPTWTSPQSRIVQLGDAAHTFVPTSGSGANMAIEDAASLASCLQVAGRAETPMAVRVHNLLRFERVSCCQILGFQNQANRENADFELLAKYPDKIMPTIGRWVWAHNAEQYAYERFDEAKESLLSGASFRNTNVPPGYTYKPWNIDELLEMMESGKPIIFEGDWN